MKKSFWFNFGRQVRIKLLRLLKRAKRIEEKKELSALVRKINGH